MEVRHRNVNNNNNNQTEQQNPVQQSVTQRRVGHLPLVPEVKKSLFYRLAATMFTPEIVEGADFIKKYFGWNENTLLFLVIVISNVTSGVVLPIKQSCVKSFFQGAQAQSFNAWSIQLMFLVPLIAFISKIEGFETYCRKKLGYNLTHAIREEFGRQWYENNAFYLSHLTESAKKLVTVGTPLVRDPHFFAQDLIDLISSRLNVLALCAGAIVSLALTSGWFLVIICLIYAETYNYITEHAVARVKENLRKEKQAEDSMKQNTI